MHKEKYDIRIWLTVNEQILTKIHKLAQLSGGNISTVLRSLVIHAQIPTDPCVFAQPEVLEIAVDPQDEVLECGLTQREIDALLAEAEAEE